MVDVLHQVCDAVFVRRIPPSQWITSTILPLPKKGNPYEMTNYRGISLMSIAAKVYNRILLNRIRPFVDPILRCNQAGFRTRRSCAEQIFILRRLMEGTDDQQLPLFTTFIDFKKAFDSIATMFKVLRHYGIPEPLVEAIKALYTNSKSAVYVDGHLTKEFEVTTGVLQGDVLAPFLFIIMIDYTMKRSEGKHGFTTVPRRPADFLRK